MVMLAVVATLATGAAWAAGPTPAAATTQSASAIHKLPIGQRLTLDGFNVVLNKVVQPGAESLGGEGFTEYNLTISNTSPDRELLLSNVALLVRGAPRSMVKDPDDIVAQGNTTEKSVATNVGAGVVGAIGGLFGVGGAIASMVTTNVAASKIYVEDPQRWRDEIKKRSFPDHGQGAAVFPTETVTASVWVRQTAAEVAERMQLYVKQGNASRIVRLDLVGMPAAAAKGN